MDIKITTNKWIELYFEINELHISLIEWKKQHSLGTLKPVKRKPSLTASEVCTILAGYHLSGYKCFEYYYHQLKQNHSQSLFPTMPTYKVFLCYIPKALPLMGIWALHCSYQSVRTDYYFVDSKTIEVCHIKRESQNLVFKDTAKKGKSSMGWFFGFKLHLVINHLGQIVSFVVTKGNVSDNNHDVLKKLLSNLSGLCVGDKGYQSALFESFFESGLHLSVKPKKNMTKQAVVSEFHARLQKKRGIIESVNDILTTVCDIEHSRHRSKANAFAHLFGGLVAYQHLDTKPHIFIKGAQNYIQNAA